ncbi:Pol [Symbiodinium sp. CCMP2592]|nr:Pol [Symbiodinium sp. CCMP2592]
MTSLVESEAHFVQRAAEVRLSDASVQALRQHGFRTLGQIAYTVGQPGQLIPEAEFTDWCRNHVPAASAADLASLKRLLFEAQTLALTQLRAQVTEPDSANKRVPEAERERRLQQLRDELSGLNIEGPLEPGRKLLDECSHQEAVGQLKYLSPDKCVSRLHEVTRAKDSSRQVEIDQSRLIIKEAQDEFSMPASSALQVQEALRRRGLAYTFAQAIVEADRLVFTRLIELNIKPKQEPSGLRPLDEALHAALESYQVSFALMHLPSKGGNNPRRPWKRQRAAAHGSTTGDAHLFQGLDPVKLDPVLFSGLREEFGRQANILEAIPGPRAHTSVVATWAAQFWDRTYTWDAAAKLADGFVPRRFFVASKFPALVSEHQQVLLVRGQFHWPVARMERLKSDFQLPPHLDCALRVLPAGAQLLRITRTVKKGVGSGFSGEEWVSAWGVPRDPQEFVAAAIRAGHPCKWEAALPQVLQNAIQRNASSSSEQLARDRAIFFKTWLSRAKELESEEASFKASLAPHVSSILAPKRLLLFKELLSAYECPDPEVFDEITHGIRLTGQTPHTGIFPPAFKPSARQADDLEQWAPGARSRVLECIKPQGDVDAVVHEKTVEEREKGFGLRQGEKIRLVDDLSFSGVNELVCHSKVVRMICDLPIGPSSLINCLHSRLSFEDRRANFDNFYFVSVAKTYKGGSPTVTDGDLWDSLLRFHNCLQESRPHVVTANHQDLQASIAPRDTPAKYAWTLAVVRGVASSLPTGTVAQGITCSLSSAICCYVDHTLQLQSFLQPVFRAEPSMSAPGGAEPKPKREKPRSHFRADGTRRRTSGEKQARKDWWQEHNAGTVAGWNRRNQPAATAATAAAQSSTQRRDRWAPARDTGTAASAPPDGDAGWGANLGRTRSEEDPRQDGPTAQRGTGRHEPEQSAEASASDTKRPSQASTTMAAQDRRTLLLRLPDGIGIPQLAAQLDDIKKESGLLQVLLSARPSKEGRWTLLLDGTLQQQDRAKAIVQVIMERAQNESRMAPPGKRPPPNVPTEANAAGPAGLDSLPLLHLPPHPSAAAEALDPEPTGVPVMQVAPTERDKASGSADPPVPDVAQVASVQAQPLQSVAETAEQGSDSAAYMLASLALPVWFTMDIRNRSKANPGSTLDVGSARLDTGCGWPNTQANFTANVQQLVAPWNLDSTSPSWFTDSSDISSSTTSSMEEVSVAAPSSTELEAKAFGTCLAQGMAAGTLDDSSEDLGRVDTDDDKDTAGPPSSEAPVANPGDMPATTGSVGRVVSRGPQICGKVAPKMLVRAGWRCARCYKIKSQCELTGCWNFRPGSVQLKHCDLTLFSFRLGPSEAIQCKTYLKGGDFNAEVSELTPHVGRALLKKRGHDGDKATNLTSGALSQIDFVAVRVQWADRLAKQSASIKLVSPWHLIRQPKPAGALIDKVAHDLSQIPDALSPGELTVKVDSILIRRAEQMSYRSIGRCNRQNILRKWRLWTQFKRASKQLRDRAKTIKRQKIQDIMCELELAAKRGDQGSTYAAVRRLAPWKPVAKPSIRGPSGELLTPTLQLQALTVHAQDKFCKGTDYRPTGVLLEGLAITSDQLQSALSRLPIRKAAPPGAAPSALWKNSAEDLAETFLYPVTHMWSSGQNGSAPSIWKDANMVWMPKPNKDPSLLANLRPIGLVHPMGKSICTLLRSRLLPVLTQALITRPQFAYAKGRSTLDALLRAHGHLTRTRQEIEAQRTSIYARHSGQEPKSCFGGICFSLDLKGAFDAVPRHRLAESLSRLQVEPDLVHLIMQQQHQSQYWTRIGADTRPVMPTQGIKQGCNIAPYLFIACTILLIDKICESTPDRWTEDGLTWYADDAFATWTIQDAASLRQALGDIQLIIAVLEEHGMAIEPSKCAVLYNLQGNEVKKILRHAKVRRQEQTYLLARESPETLVPIKKQHEYLGTILAYRDPQTRLVTRKHRYRIWKAGVQASACYGLLATGLTVTGRTQLLAMSARQLRSIAGRPAHLTHESNAEIRNLFDCVEWTEDLLTLAKNRLAELRTLQETQPENIVTRPQALQQLTHAMETFQQVIPIERPKQDRQFEDICRVRPEIKFDPAEHAIGGLPQCAGCKHKFQSWQALKTHIEKGQCHQQGEDNPEPSTGPAQTTAPPPVNLTPAAQATEEQPRLPPHRNLKVADLIRDQGWEALVNSEHAEDLKQHCCICARWMVDTTSIKRHMRYSHPEIWKQVSERLESTCSVFKPRLTRDGICPYCQRTSYNRHFKQCCVIEQIQMFGYLLPGLSESNKRPPATPQQQNNKGDESGKGGGKRRRTRRGQGGQGSRNSAPAEALTKDGGRLLNLISRILLQHEDSINAAKMDRGFTVFMAQTGPAGLLTSLYNASIAWNQVKDNEPAKITKPLRITLLTMMIAELKVRLQNLEKKQEAKQLAISAGWLDQQDRLLYQKWDAENAKLVPHSTMPGLVTTEVMQTLTEIEPLILESLVLRFHAPRKIKPTPETENNSVFKLEVSLRSTEADQLYQSLAKLENNAVWQLIGCQLRKDGMRRSNPVQELMKLLTQEGRPLIMYNT